MGRSLSGRVRSHRPTARRCSGPSTDQVGQAEPNEQVGDGATPAAAVLPSMLGSALPLRLRLFLTRLTAATIAVGQRSGGRPERLHDEKARRKESSVAYDEDLADRVRAVLPPGAPVTERQMFGGLAFMVGGHMAFGVVKDTLRSASVPRAPTAPWTSRTCGRWTSPAGL
jgi:hypothetical protein